mmetsp:Transcript_42162/g.127916  ORF Transcript_42162/g.127916 Transcript_42162/m.127916 type:complete len:189 (-) Transcript_42162:93-659(-)
MTTASVLHHSIAHAILFGTYEISKRFLLEAVQAHSHSYSDRWSKGVQLAKDGDDSMLDKDSVEDWDEMTSGSTKQNNGMSVKYSHLVAIGTAGGIAGSVQHVTSHFTEQRLGIVGGWDDTINEERKRFNHDRNRHAALPHGKQIKASKLPAAKLRWFQPLPSLRPTVLAFFPSAVGFMAFEYGKNLVT